MTPAIGARRMNSKFSVEPSSALRVSSCWARRMRAASRRARAFASATVDSSSRLPGIAPAFASRSTRWRSFSARASEERAYVRFNSSAARSAGIAVLGTIRARISP